MAQRDGASFIKAVYTIGGGAHTGNVTGSTIDTQGFNRVTLYTLPESWTDGTHTFTVQDSPDGTTWAPADPTSFSASWPAPAPITSAGTAVPQKAAYVGPNRYVRVNVAVTGATTGAKYAVLAVLAEPRVLPAQA